MQKKMIKEKDEVPAVLIRFQNPQLDKSYHGGLFHARMGFLGTIGHQLGEQGCLLIFIPIFGLQGAYHLGTCRQKAIENALTCRCLKQSFM